MAPRVHIHLPEELWEKIFSQHHVKSLMQLRCVCKFWNQIITSKSFAKAHYDQQKTSKNTPNYLLLDYYYSYSASLFDIKSSVVLESNVSDKVDIFGRDSSYYGLEAYGICDGLLCLSDHSGPLSAPIFLWNPILKKGLKLPSLHELKIGREDLLRTSYLCFGYHDDGYKVIKVVPFPHMYCVYVYSLGTNNWKSMKFDLAYDPIREVIKPYRKALLVNGIAYIVSPQDRRVVYFDLSCEIMRETNIPRDFTCSTDLTLEEYRQSIALIDKDSNSSVVMRVLRLSGNSFSWSYNKILLPTPDRNIRIYPMSFINKYELMITICDKCFFYNVKKRLLRQIKTLEGKTCPRRIMYFRESILLLGETTYLEKPPCLEDI